MAHQNPERDFGLFIQEQGLRLDEDPIMDGRVHRAPAMDGKPGNKDGAYQGYLDGRPSGWARNFQTGGDIVKWKAERENRLTPADRVNQAAAIRARIAEREVSRELQINEAAQRSELRWNGLQTEQLGNGPTYLDRKQIAALGVRFDGDNVVIPVRDLDGKLWSLQTISPDPNIPKLFEKGARKAGNMHVIGDLENGKPILVAEGYATGASLAMASGRPVAVAFDAGNLAAVVGLLAERYPASPMAIMADDDRYRQDEINVGVEKARQVAAEHGAVAVPPQFQSYDRRPTDFNDLHTLEGLDAVAGQVEKAVELSISRKRSTESNLNQPGKGDAMSDPTKANPPTSHDRIRYSAQRGADGGFESFTIKMFSGKDLVKEAKDIERGALKELLGKSMFAELEEKLGSVADGKKRVQGTIKADPGQPLAPAVEQDNRSLASRRETTGEKAVPRAVERPTLAPDPELRGQADLFNTVEPSPRSDLQLKSQKGATAFVDASHRAVAVEMDSKVYLLGGIAAIDKFAKQSQLSDGDKALLVDLHGHAFPKLDSYEAEVVRRTEELQRFRQRAQNSDKAPSPPPVVDGEIREAPIRPEPPQDALPLDLQKQFIKVQNKFYHAERPDSLAFVDKGQRLETKSDSDRTAAAFVAIADTRGWDSVKVSGSQSFRREVWLEAMTRGITVSGYKPRDVDYALLEHRMTTGRTNSVEQDGGQPRSNDVPAASGRSNRTPSNIKVPDRETEPATADLARSSGPTEPRSSKAARSAEPSTGILLEHGAAKYNFDPEESNNYYVKLLNNGKEQIIWGVKLGDALQSADARVGDKIALSRAGAESVLIEKNVRDGQGQVVGQETAQAHRNEWKVEVSDVSKQVRREQAAEDFKNLPLREAATRHPELVAAAGVMAAASVLAKEKFPDDRSREQFLQQTRSRVADDVATGRPLHPVQMHRAPVREVAQDKREPAAKRLDRSPSRSR